MQKKFILGAFFGLITGSVMGALAADTPLYSFPGEFSREENENKGAFSLVPALKRLGQERQKNSVPLVNNKPLVNSNNWSPIREYSCFGSDSPIPLLPREDTLQNPLSTRERAYEAFLRASECLALIPQKSQIAPVTHIQCSKELPKQWGWIKDLSSPQQEKSVPFYGVSETSNSSAYTRPLAFARSPLDKLGIRRTAAPQKREDSALPTLKQLEKIIDCSPQMIYRTCLDWSCKMQRICIQEKASLDLLFQETYVAIQNSVKRFYANNEEHCPLLSLFSTFFQYLTYNLQRIERDSEKAIQIFNRTLQENIYGHVSEAKFFLDELVVNANTVLKNYRSKKENFLKMVTHFERTGSILCDENFKAFYPQWVDALTQLYNAEEQKKTKILNNIENFIWKDVSFLFWQEDTCSADYLRPADPLLLEFAGLVRQRIQKAKQNLVQLEAYQKPIQQENTRLLNLSEIAVLTQTVGQFYRERQEGEQLKEGFFCVYHPIQEKEEIEYGPAFDFLYTQWVEEAKIWCEEKKNALQIKFMSEGLEGDSYLRNPIIQSLITQLEIAPSDLESMWQNFRKNQSPRQLTPEEIEYLTRPLHFFEEWKKIYERCL